jgi:pimeloyl-ACP methyl ester carboxylesterase
MGELPSTLKATIQGRDLEYVLSGTGQPVVVLLNGAGVRLDAWSKLHPTVESLGTIFAYSRLGDGGSDPPTEPQTGEVIVATLRALLAEVHLSPPYVLVGHSLGGLYANLYARLFPSEVVGIVFLEASAPQDVESIELYQGAFQRGLERTMISLYRLFGKDPRRQQEEVRETARRIATAGAFPNVPLVVVSGAMRPPPLLMSSAAFEFRAANQRELCMLSPRSKQLIATRSSHFPQLTEPEVVIQAIRDVVTWPDVH